MDQCSFAEETKSCVLPKNMLLCINSSSSSFELFVMSIVLEDVYTLR